jgi:aspartate kinase
MQEMAEAGAKVLNAQAVEFAKARGIAIYARATASPPLGEDPASDGTIVRKFAPHPPGAVVGVASEKDLLVLQGRVDADALLEFLDAHQVCGKQLQATITGHASDGVTLVLSRENLHDEDRFRRALGERFGDAVRLVDGVGAVSAIGAGINTSYQQVRAGTSALAGRRVLGISTSSSRVTWLLPVTFVEDGVRSLHATFLPPAA